MTKTQVQRNREHIARIRRKAHAFDKLADDLKTITFKFTSDNYLRREVELAVERAERQAGE